KVRTYQKITYKNLYNGIDLEFFINEKGNAEYNYIVHPGADAYIIRWKYKGANNIVLNNKKIILQVAKGKIEECLPISYLAENRLKVSVGYALLKKNEFTFSLPLLTCNKS